MILSHQQRFIFVHSRKTAGSAITAALNHHLGPRDIQLGAWPEAIASGDEINKCPPGGEATIKQLAELMGVEAKPLDAAHGEEDVKKVAFIREDECIGCTKCIQACPVDAILGAAKHMHTVITDECTGCDLCVDPCPVDCIDMVPIAQTTSTWKWDFESSPKGDIPIKMVS